MSSLHENSSPGSGSHGRIPRKQRSLQVSLEPHPLTHQHGVDTSSRRLEVSLTPSEQGVQLRYLWLGSSAEILWPEPAGRSLHGEHGRPGEHGLRGERRDYLWHHTCGEWFIGETGSPGYIEFNFSPSGHWAAYRFADYRESLGDLTWQGPPPQIDFSLEAGRAELCAEVPWAAFAGFATEPLREWQLAFTCVVERCMSPSPGGDTTAATALEYWAVSHPRAQPEFHDRNGFSVLW
ncbi:MAG: hypothetical protein FGM43_04570 [Sinobacteraceae bacterium]|nr:hypothetical protein [Nevskiaceae bacterium]